MSAWAQIPDRLLLLELWISGEVPQRRIQQAAWERLRALPWTRLSGRRGVLELRSEHRDAVADLLDRVWTTWCNDHADLVAIGSPPTPQGWRQLTDARRHDRLPSLPGRLNQHTLAALVAPHAKASLTADRLAMAPGVEITSGAGMRMRPSPGLVAMRDGQRVDLAGMAAVLGEVLITARAIADGLTFDGDQPQGILTIENLGTYEDAQIPSGWLVGYLPGWDINVMPHLRRLIPAPVPWVHWGDLDPNGVIIARALRTVDPTMHWFMPSWVAEYLPYGLPQPDWSRAAITTDDPLPVQQFAAAHRCLEQEVYSLDPRIPATVLACCGTPGAGHAE